MPSPREKLGHLAKVIAAIGPANALGVLDVIVKVLDADERNADALLTPAEVKNIAALLRAVKGFPLE